LVKEVIVMAVLIANFSVPTEYVKEMANRAPEVMSKVQQPDDVIMRGPFWYSDLEKGMRALAVIEVDASKIVQERLRMAAFLNAFHGIPGYKWNIEIWLDQADIQARIEKYGF
jgi:hypothetical protein